MTDAMQIDWEAAQTFLGLLGKNGNTRCRAFFHKSAPAEVKRKGARKPALNPDAIKTIQLTGRGIYVVINEGGDKAEDIKLCLAYFVEFDGMDEGEQWDAVNFSGLPEPSIVNATGGGSLHFYWVLSEPIEDVEQWKADTKRLIAHLGSDKAVNDPSRVMRLPGCWYMDGNGQPVAQVQIVHQTDARYTREQIIGCLPAPKPVALVTPQALSICTDAERTERRALEQLQRIPARIPGSGTRDSYLRLLWGLVAITGPERAAQLMAQHSPEWAAQDDLSKIAKVANGSIKGATFFEVAKVEWGITSPKSSDGYTEATPEEIKQSETIDELLGPVQEGKLRRPRTDVLTKAIEIILPLRWNLLTQRIENDGEAVDGDFLGTLYLQLAELHQIEVAKERAADAATLVARRNAYHPVRDYLDGLSTELATVDWEQIAACCFNNPDPWAQTLLQRQLIGLVARAIQPGCKLDTALVIHSPEQGIGKSTFWAILGGEWFSDSLGDLRAIREEQLAIHSAWIHEWGEIDAVVGKRESETLKKFLSSTCDNVRRPYGRGIESLKRSCGIVGTTNRDDFIKDPTGNRRFPVFSVNKVNTDWVKEHRDAIWGSALAAYRKGTPWHFSEDENKAISDYARRYAAEDTLLDQLETWMEDNPDEATVTTPQVVYALNPERLGDQEFARQVAIRLRSLGWAKGERQRGYLPNGTRHERATSWQRA